MSKVIDVSGKLGEYMLKGWILTDRICQKCSKVPLMRSPTDNTVYFCANCDNGPGPSASVSSNSARSSLDSGSHISRASTPITEVSNAPSSPTFAPAMDTEEILRRRQQSDLASSEIGKLLLKGWAMLADECPNPQCYGIPLVRPPKAGGEKDPRKECVVCHTVYVDETDARGIEHLVPMEQTSTRSRAAADGPPSAPSQPAPVQSVAKEKGKGVLRSVDPVSIAASDGLIAGADPIVEMATTRSEGRTDVSLHQDTSGAAEALQQSLRALTERLKTLSSPYGMDVALIGQTADAISKVSQALLHVQQLERTSR